MSIKVSVIIPVFNTENDLERCIVSALSQTLKEIEIIVVDDGSTDKSGEICDFWKEKDSRITVIHQKNSGVSAARNAGLDIAKGDFVCFFDSDDYAHEEMLEKLYNVITEKNADMCTCESYLNDFFTKKESYIDEITCQPMKAEYFFVKYLQPGIAPYTLWTSMYKMKLIKQYSLKFCSYKEVFSEDALFNFMFWSVCNKYVFLNEPLYYYYRHENSLMTRSIPGNYIQRHVKLVEKYEEFIKHNNLKVNIKSETAGLLWEFIRIACARSKGNVDLIVKDFKLAAQNRIFKRKMRSLAFGYAGYKYCRYNSIKGKMAIHFRLIAFYLLTGKFEKAARQYFI